MPDEDIAHEEQSYLIKNDINDSHLTSIEESIISTSSEEKVDISYSCEKA